MGLDITHYKATLIKPKSSSRWNLNFQLEEYFTDGGSGFDVDFNYFSSYVQLIDVPKTLKELIIVKDESKLDEVKKVFKDSDDRWRKLTGKPDENENRLILCEPDSLSIDNTANKILCPSEENRLFVERSEHRLGIFVRFELYQLEQKIGFYYEEVGYQRKGMGSRFNHYTNGGTHGIYCFTAKSDFEYALTCVDYYWQDDDEEDVITRREQFKANFVDSYKPNCSWMSVSY